MGKWENPPAFDQSVAAVLLIDADSNIIAQYRDAKAPKDPNMIGLWGGRLEPTDATAVEGAARELREETNRPVPAAELEPFMAYTYTTDGIVERIYIFVSRGHTTEGLEVYEGRGFYIIKDANDPLLSPVIKRVVKAWFDQNR
jgi:8-oxo-dGTP pyrophosphatase MutT (NUDIX family)